MGGGWGLVGWEVKDSWARPLGKQLGDSRWGWARSIGEYARVPTVWPGQVQVHGAARGAPTDPGASSLRLDRTLASSSD